MNNKEFTEKAIKLSKEKTSYMFGAFCWPATEKSIKRLLNQYEDNYEWLWKANSIKGQGYIGDCVGIIKGILWGFNFDMEKSYGGAIYCSNGVPDIDADTLIKKCTNVTTSLNNAVCGEVVWMQGHVGIVVSPTQVVECTPIGSCGVQITNLKTRGWKKKGRLPWIDYSSIASTNNIQQQEQSSEVAYAQYFNKKLAGSYGISTGGYGLNLRKDANQSAGIIRAFPDDTEVICYGYYSVEKNTGVRWYLVAIGRYKGFMSSEYLTRI
jgi:hypothetical protein